MRPVRRFMQQVEDEARVGGAGRTQILLSLCMENVHPISSGHMGQNQSRITKPLHALRLWYKDYFSGTKAIGPKVPLRN